MRTVNIAIAPKLQCLITAIERIIALYGGRGGAKSESVARALIIRMLIDEDGYNDLLKILCTRELQNSIEESVLSLLVKIIMAYRLQNYFKITKTSISCYNRLGTKYHGIETGKFLFKGFKSSTDRTQSLKSIDNIKICWVEEAQTLSQDSLDILAPSIRAKNSQIIFTYNRRLKKDPVHEFCQGRDDVLLIKIGWEDNPFITDALKSEALQLRKSNPEKYKHVWGGEPAIVVDSPLWAYDVIQQARPSSNKWLSRVFRVEDYSSIVVGVDPAISVDKTSDLTGIVVVGKLKEPRLDINNNLTTDNYVVIEDLTAKLAPEEWARETARAVVRFQAECVVAEKNQGGEMVRAMLDQAKVNAHVELVHASKGKITRAEPIAAMYGRKEVVHLKEFYPLTEQMAMFSTRGYMGEDSPDRVDALVWGVWWLAELGDHDFVELY